MLPLVLDVSSWPVVLVGAGEAGRKRLALLTEAGVADLRVFAPDNDLPGAACLPTDAEVASARLLFVAGLPEPESARLAGVARAHRVLVNVEDVIPLCDAHVPSIVRRGDLLLTVSTAGRSPGLAVALRERLAAEFGPEWSERLDALAAHREALRARGLRYGEVLAQTRAFLAERGWLATG